MLYNAFLFNLEFHPKLNVCSFMLQRGMGTHRPAVISCCFPIVIEKLTSYFLWEFWRRAAWWICLPTGRNWFNGCLQKFPSHKCSWTMTSLCNHPIHNGRAWDSSLMTALAEILPKYFRCLFPAIGSVCTGDVRTERVFQENVLTELYRSYLKGLVF